MTKKYKVVIDTNIFIQGWFYGNLNCQTILKLIRDNKIYLGFSQDSIGELLYVTKNFARKFIDDKNDRLKTLNYISKLFYYGSSVNIADMDDVSEIKDKTDLMFVQCAIGYNADFIISNDYKSGMFDVSQYSFNVLSAEDFIELINEI